MADDRLEQKIAELADKYRGPKGVADEGMRCALREMHEWAVEEQRAEVDRLKRSLKVEIDASLRTAALVGKAGLHYDGENYTNTRAEEAERHREEFREALRELCPDCAQGRVPHQNQQGFWVHSGVEKTAFNEMQGYKRECKIPTERLKALLTPPPAQETGREEKP